jgi:hypothetical protein
MIQYSGKDNQMSGCFLFDYINKLLQPKFWGGFVYFVMGRMLDQWGQDSNPGGLKKGRFITLAGQHLDLSKNGTSPAAQGCGVFNASECGTKQVGRTKADMAVSLSLGGYNISH